MPALERDRLLPQVGLQEVERLQQDGAAVLEVAPELRELVFLLARP
jgi:hypothetical protein